MEVESSNSKFFVRIIDILYAVTIGNGIKEISGESYLNLPQNLKNVVSIDFFLFLFALFIIFKDLIGYNQSIRKRPHKSIVRFVLDIGILFVFFFLIRSCDNWERYLLFLIAHFILGFVWRVKEGLEWRSDQKYRDSDAEEIKMDLQFSIIACSYLIVIYIASIFLVNSYWRVAFLLLFVFLLLTGLKSKLSSCRVINRCLSFLDPVKSKIP